MALFQTSRELAARVEKDAQRHPNRFRRMTWWAALWLSVSCLAWLGFEGANGENHIYEGGDLAIAHRMFENDCSKCHTTWAPLQRLVKFDLVGQVHSVTNAACLSCHPGNEHHHAQLPTHEEISCSFCHLEHVGDHDLKRLSDTTCTACHRKLDTHFLAKDDRKSPSFERSVTSFTEHDGHPEFAFRRLTSSTAISEASEIGAAHKIREVLEQVDQGGKSIWRDKGKIKFNHAKHLEVITGPDGKPNFAILQRLGIDTKSLNGIDPASILDATQACQLCHKTDADGRYMLAINFEQHCNQCHKLYFDGDREVPHESPEVVRGFLTDYFTMAAVRSPERLQLSESDRGIPGRQQRPRLSKLEAETVVTQVAKVEGDLLKLVSTAESLTGRRELGVRSACVKCHYSGVDTGIQDGDSSAPKKSEMWAIVKPSIPTRWQSHSVFSHKGHQMLNCAECHGLANKDDNDGRSELPQPGVFHSKDTGDVLLPGINLCRKCHSETPVIASGGLTSRVFGARSGCVECHNYHGHAQQAFVGHRNPVFGTSDVPLDALLKGRSNQEPLKQP